MSLVVLLLDQGGVWACHEHDGPAATAHGTDVHAGASPFPFHCPVDGGTSEAEQVGELSVLDYG